MVVTENDHSLDEPTTTPVGILREEKKENENENKNETETDRPRVRQNSVHLAAQLAAQQTAHHTTCLYMLQSQC